MTRFHDGFLMLAAGIALAILTLSVVLALVRLIRGPTLPDRVVALDLITTTAVGIMAAYSVIAGESSILDAAIVVALITFLGTVAFASYLQKGRAQ
jgi:multicomponent Na+:H+ antiporter subunit F